GLRLARLYSVPSAGETTTAQDLCPFKGLASFEETDAEWFFGRERLVGELAARLVDVGLLGVVGDSGSGKSSVVAAGLIPSLRAGLLPGSERWQHASMRPGAHPKEELHAATAQFVDGAPFEEAVGRIPPGSRLVLFVDQFEEVFTVCSDDDERESFVGALTEAAIQSP